MEHRPWAWLTISGAEQRKRARMAGYFDAMVHRGEVDSEVAHQIELVCSSALQICTFAAISGRSDIVNIPTCFASSTF